VWESPAREKKVQDGGIDRKGEGPLLKCQKFYFCRRGKRGGPMGKREQSSKEILSDST